MSAAGELAAAADGVREITPLIAPIRERGDRRRGEREFPRIDGDEEEEEEEQEREETPRPSGSRDPDQKEPEPAPDPEHDGRIDIRVAGRLLPTRQFLPAPPRGATLH